MSLLAYEQHVGQCVTVDVCQIGQSMCHCRCMPQMLENVSLLMYAPKVSQCVIVDICPKGQSMCH